MRKSSAKVVIAGAGFSGLAMGERLKRSGATDFVVLERAEDVGGTWQHNTYPGCTCDVPSHLYSLSFAPNPNWSQTYSPQPEIRDYLRADAPTGSGCARISARTSPSTPRTGWRTSSSGS